MSIQDIARGDQDLGLKLAVSSVEVGWHVIVVVHGDHDSVERRDSGHGDEGNGAMS
jgi:hypothetical protein